MLHSCENVKAALSPIQTGDASLREVIVSLFAAVSVFLPPPPVFLQASAEHHRFFSLLFSCFNHFSSATCKNELLEKLTFCNAFES